MDKHYLAPLFTPASIAVLAGRRDDAVGRTPLGIALSEALRAQRYTGRLQFVDIHATGTLADLAQTRADLAIIALPPGEAAAALEAAGRMKCRAALVVSSGMSAEQSGELLKIARREGLHLLGPNSLGFQRPALQLNASAAELTDTERIIGVSRYVTNLDQTSCEFSLLVADEFMGQGLGSRLMESIMAVARDAGLSEMEGLVLAGNSAMLKLMKGLGFSAKRFAEDPDFNIVSHAL